MFSEGFLILQVFAEPTISPTSLASDLEAIPEQRLSPIAPEGNDFDFDNLVTVFELISDCLTALQGKYLVILQSREQ